jgi:hypothetical protein
MTSIAGNEATAPETPHFGLPWKGLAPIAVAIIIALSPAPAGL